MNRSKVELFRDAFRPRDDTTPFFVAVRQKTRRCGKARDTVDDVIIRVLTAHIFTENLKSMRIIFCGV